MNFLPIFESNNNHHVISILGGQISGYINILVSLA